jgi:hypothetical protein
LRSYEERDVKYVDATHQKELQLKKSRTSLANFKKSVQQAMKNSLKKGFSTASTVVLTGLGEVLIG